MASHEKKSFMPSNLERMSFSSGKWGTRIVSTLPSLHPKNNLLVEEIFLAVETASRFLFSSLANQILLWESFTPLFRRSSDVRGRQNASAISVSPKPNLLFVYINSSPRKAHTLWGRHTAALLWVHVQATRLVKGPTFWIIYILLCIFMLMCRLSSGLQINNRVW